MVNRFGIQFLPNNSPRTGCRPGGLPNFGGIDTSKFRLVRPVSARRTEWKITPPDTVCREGLSCGGWDAVDTAVRAPAHSGLGRRDRGGTFVSPGVISGEQLN